MAHRLRHKVFGRPLTRWLVFLKAFLGRFRLICASFQGSSLRRSLHCRPSSCTSFLLFKDMHSADGAILVLLKDSFKGSNIMQFFRWTITASVWLQNFLLLPNLNPYHDSSSCCLSLVSLSISLSLSLSLSPFMFLVLLTPSDRVLVYRQGGHWSHNNSIIASASWC